VIEWFLVAVVCAFAMVMYGAARLGWGAHAPGSVAARITYVGKAVFVGTLAAPVAVFALVLYAR